MRLYCASRNVPSTLQAKVYEWVQADQEHVQAVGGVATVAHRLPSLPRTELLSITHEAVMRQLPLSPRSVSSLIMRLHPTVCMRGMMLAAEGEECRRLFIMQRGSLRLTSSLTGTHRRSSHACAASERDANRTSGMMKKMCGDGALANANMSVAAAAHQRANDRHRAKVGAAGELHRGGFRSSYVGRGVTTFRMVEREGAFVGLSSLEEDATVRLPYSVEAQRASRLLHIDRDDLLTALRASFSDEVEGMRRMMAQAHQMHLDSLKVGAEAVRKKYGERVDASLQGRAAGARSGSKGGATAALIIAERDLVAISSKCLKRLRELSAETQCLPDLLRDMQDAAERRNSPPAAAAPAAAVAAPATAQTPPSPAPSEDPSSPPLPPSPLPPLPPLVAPIATPADPAAATAAAASPRLGDADSPRLSPRLPMGVSTWVMANVPTRVAPISPRAGSSFAQSRLLQQHRLPPLLAAPAQAAPLAAPPAALTQREDAAADPAARYVCRGTISPVRRAKAPGVHVKELITC